MASNNHTTIMQMEKIMELDKEIDKLEFIIERYIRANEDNTNKIRRMIYMTFILQLINVVLVLFSFLMLMLGGIQVHVVSGVSQGVQNVNDIITVGK